MSLGSRTMAGRDYRAGPEAMMRPVGPQDTNYGHTTASHWPMSPCRPAAYHWTDRCSALQCQSNRKDDRVPSTALSETAIRGGPNAMRQYTASRCRSMRLTTITELPFEEEFPRSACIRSSWVIFGFHSSALASKHRPGVASRSS